MEKEGLLKRIATYTLVATVVAGLSVGMKYLPRDESNDIYVRWGNVGVIAPGLVITNKTMEKYLD